MSSLAVNLIPFPSCTERGQASQEVSSRTEKEEQLEVKELQSLREFIDIPRKVRWGQDAEVKESKSMPEYPTLDSSSWRPTKPWQNSRKYR